jgi:hypothetical protein
VKAGWIAARAVDGAAVVMGHLPAGPRPGRLHQLRVSAIERKPKRKSQELVTPCHRALETRGKIKSWETLQTAESEREFNGIRPAMDARILSSSARPVIWQGGSDHVRIGP